MRRFHRPILLVSSLLLCSACAFAADPPLRFDPDVEARLDAALRERMAAQRPPSIAVLISVSGQGEYRRAFGEANLRTHAPRKLDDPFRIASITKRGYLWNLRSESFEDMTVLNPAPAGGARAMNSTLADLKRYARALCMGTLLKPETQRLRLEATRLEGEPAFVTYGAGIARIGRFCGHNGTIFGFSSEMFYLPEKDAVIVIDVNRLDLDDKSQSTETFLSVTKLLFPEYVNW